jgi:hypothetical protein
LASAYAAHQGGDTELTITKEQFNEACMKDAFKDVQMPM